MKIRYKIRSYQNAYLQLRKLDQPLSAMTDEEIGAIKGVGKAIAAKIRELLDTGTMQTLERYRAQTPKGIEEMLGIKGFGPKKIRVIWQDLGVESAGELLYAVNENRLIDLKGFGPKTQSDLKKKLEYFLRSRHQYHFASLEGEAEQLLLSIQQQQPELRCEWTGAIRRKSITLEQIELLVEQHPHLESLLAAAGVTELQQQEGQWQGRSPHDIPLVIYPVAPEDFDRQQFRLSAAPEFLNAFSSRFPAASEAGPEQAIFEQAGIPFLAPELRETDYFMDHPPLGKLITEDAVKGVIHTHTTYSDGLHELREMAEYAKEQGFLYIGITDHSQSAFYANGLKEDRVREQWAAIDALNLELAPFRILKGIESDILNNGELDYSDELLEGFDFVIASIHSNLRMDKEKATQRLLKAIENPYTSMLGHPTGRLLLSREGYPIDHMAVIDACAEQGVVIEINANPYRLDLDWEWIPYAMEKGVLISVNPDAHSKAGIHDIHYGIAAARKGGLTAEACLNTRDAAGFLAGLKSR